ncbi:hypothetical protein F3K43_44765 [Streptomyces sp. LBUM 1476]|nr:hypothetical protein [Streptomyces sp. LBUM 1476]
MRLGVHRRRRPEPEPRPSTRTHHLRHPSPIPTPSGTASSCPAADCIPQPSTSPSPVPTTSAMPPAAVPDTGGGGGISGWIAKGINSAITGFFKTIVKSALNPYRTSHQLSRHSSAMEPESDSQRVSPGRIQGTSNDDHLQFHTPSKERITDPK